MLYTDRVTISRAVAELEHRGFLRRRQGSYTISDPEKLTVFIEEKKERKKACLPMADTPFLTAEFILRRAAAGSRAPR